jgi:hypothetical protein
MISSISAITFGSIAALDRPPTRPKVAPANNSARTQKPTAAKSAAMPRLMSWADLRGQAPKLDQARATVDYLRTALDEPQAVPGSPVRGISPTALTRDYSFSAKRRGDVSSTLNGFEDALSEQRDMAGATGAFSRRLASLSTFARATAAVNAAARLS